MILTYFKKIIFLPGLMVLLYPVFSAEPALNFEHLNVEQGLSHSTVQCIYKDSQGFMWFGTPLGLNKFDGFEIVVYHHNSNDTNSISDDNVSDIFEDSNKTM